MAKEKKIYLVDTENVNDIWVNLLDRLEAEDRIVVFYTNNSPHMCVDKVVKLMNWKRKCITWIKCFEGNNALDFQLVTQLGAMIAKNPQNEYWIVSSDNGFEAVVKYWQKNNVHVNRIKGSECKIPDVTLDSPLGFLENQKEIDCVLELSKSISVKKLSALHVALSRIFGPEVGKRIYRSIKEHQEIYPIFSSNYLADKKERVEQYLKLIFHLNGIDDTQLDEVLQIYQQTEKNDLQAINTAFQTTFEKDKAMAYYKVIKTHNQVLQNL